MTVLRAALFVAVLCIAGAQAQTSCSSWSWATDCLNQASCTWCGNSYSSASYDGSGTCQSSTSCTGTYTTAVSNPCTAYLSQSTCTPNMLCGWCLSSGVGTCMYSGYSGSTPSQCNTFNGATFTQQTCSALTSRDSCMNAVGRTCYYCTAGCSSTYCSTWTSSTTCPSYSTSSGCTSSLQQLDNLGYCGWCGNYRSTGQTRCQYYTGLSPSSCTGSWTYNTGYNGGAAFAVAAGLIGVTLIIVIVAPLVICVCVIGCSVYFCCIRKNNTTTVVVQGGPNYQPMNGQPVQYAQPMNNGYPDQTQAYPPMKQ